MNREEKKGRREEEKKRRREEEKKCIPHDLIGIKFRVAIEVKDDVE